MTKAELLKRYRWFPVVLPFAAAIGWCVVRHFAIIPFVRLGEAPSLFDPALIYLHRISGFGLTGWILLTLACSLWTMHSLQVDAELRGRRALVFAWVVAPVIFVFKLIVGALVFTFRPV